MPNLTQEYLSEYSVRQLYDLVLDIENYPEFLPWCTAARIVERNEDSIIADLAISYKSITEYYRSRILFNMLNENEAFVEVTAIEGPFKYLLNEWHFKKVGKKTKIHFYVDFAFKSGLLESLVGLFFSKACKKMISAFEVRAGKLYNRSK